MESTEGKEMDGRGGYVCSCWKTEVVQEDGIVLRGDESARRRYLPRA